MPARRNCIAKMDTPMDFQLSLSPLPSQSLEPLPTEAPSPPTSMPLPPKAVYSFKEELYTSIQAWAAQYGYAFNIGRSKKINSGPKLKITYNCDRYGPPPPENHPQNYLQARKWQITTRKTGCQFSIVTIKQDMQWELRHRPGIQYNIDNHPPNQTINSHPAHRKLAQEEINQAKALHNTGNIAHFFK